MRKNAFIGAFVAIVLTLLTLSFSFASPPPLQAAGNGCSNLYQRSDITSWGEKSFNLNCDRPTTLYVGVCDIGGDRPDDLFQVNGADGTLLSQNGVDENGRETVTIKQVQLQAGFNQLTLKSRSASGYAPYLLIAREDPAALGFQLLNGCGYDYVGEGRNTPGPDGSCNVDIQIFMTDPAPSAGKVIVTYQYGQLNRPEGILRASTIVAAGERIDWKVNVPAPKWIRVWYQPVGSTTWQLLPAQYWQGDGNPTSEFGVWCADDGNLPSYHTSFSKGIPAGNVPLFDVGG